MKKDKDLWLNCEITEYVERVSNKPSISGHPHEALVRQENVDYLKRYSCYEWFMVIHSIT